MWKIHSKDINHIIKNDNFHHLGLRKIDLKFLRSRSRSRSIFCKFTYSELVHAKDQVQRGWSWSFAVKITDLTQLWTEHSCTIQHKDYNLVLRTLSAISSEAGNLHACLQFGYLALGISVACVIILTVSMWDWEPPSPSEMRDDSR